MECIKHLGIEKDINGNRISYGIFLCPYCLQKVKKRLQDGVKNKSCGCYKGFLVSKSRVGKKHSEETKQKIGNGNKGKKYSDESKQKISKALKGIKFTQERKLKLSGENSHTWKNGISFLPYSPEFNKQKKQQILERDNYECQDPNCEHKSSKLHIHHIDYDKKNNLDENLITLCNSCHSKTNHKNRPQWSEFYQNIMKAKI